LRWILGWHLCPGTSQAHKPYFADKITNMYLGGLSLKFVFTELFSKYLKDKDRSRIGDDLDKNIEMEKRQAEAKEVRDLILEALKKSDDTQKEELKIFQEIKNLSTKSNINELVYKQAKISLKLYNGIG